MRISSFLLNPVATRQTPTSPLYSHRDLPFAVIITPHFTISLPTAAMSRPPPLSEIESGLFLGNDVTSRRAHSSLLESYKIIAVVSVLDTKFNSWGRDWYRAIIPGSSHLYIPCNDSSTQDLLPELANICDFIDKARGPNRTSSVLIHCRQGRSRLPRSSSPIACESTVGASARPWSMSLANS